MLGLGGFGVILDAKYCLWKGKEISAVYGCGELKCQTSG